MHHIKYLIYIFGTSVFAPGAFSAGVPFPTLQFLVGNWEAESKPGEASAHFEFSLDLQGKVLVRRNHVEYPATPGQQALVHDDLLVTYQEGIPASTRAVYFDNEGYVARYVVTSSGPGQVVFVSESVTKVARYRLTYTQLPDGRLNAKLEVAPPGKPNAFANYLEWVSKRVTRNQSDAAVTPPAKP
jgi:hypothetical protein